MSADRRPFISDMGSNLVLRSSDESTTELERYAAWTWCAPKGKHQVAEVSNDLDRLKRAYRVSDDRVLRLEKRPE